jgi:uncharacterized protein (DUF427 family)
MSQDRQVQKSAWEVYAPQQDFLLVSTPKWVRAYFGKTFIADSKRVKLMYENGRLPVYYFPKEDVRMDLFKPSDYKSHSSLIGEASYWHVEVNGRVAENAVWWYEDPKSPASELAGYVSFDWEKMDAWFEEGEQVFVHPHDPFHRIDLRKTTRHIRVVLGGETVAETERAVMLFETGLPARYYIPLLDLRMDLLLPSDHQTSCPYKGDASYYSLQVGDEVYENIAWYYPYPHPEVGKIQNLVSFFQEQVDALYVDGQQMAKPETPWSK